MHYPKQYNTIKSLIFVTATLISITFAEFQVELEFNAVSKDIISIISGLAIVVCCNESGGTFSYQLTKGHFDRVLMKEVSREPWVQFTHSFR